MPVRLQTATGALSYDLAGQGPPILLLHPIGADRRMWSGVITLLAPRFRCIAPDQRGWGESEYTPAPCDLAADVRSILADCAVDAPQIVMAVNRSAEIAIDLSLTDDHPPAGLILLNPVLREYVDPRDRLYLGDTIARGEAAVARTVAIHSRPAVPRSRAAAMVRLLSGGRDTGPQHDDTALAEDIVALARRRARKPQGTVPIRVASRLKDSTAPVEVITVATDQAPGAIDALSAAIRAALPGASTRRIVSSWGGLFPLAHPQDTAQIIEASAGALPA